MNIVLIKDSIPLDKLREIGKEFYSLMIKGVVDIKREVVAFGGEYHMDSNVLILEDGSKQADVWGFNLYFDKPRDNWLEYTSLINIRPAAKNFDMEVQDEEIKKEMMRIINSKVTQ